MAQVFLFDWFFSFIGFFTRLEETSRVIFGPFYSHIAVVPGYGESKLTHGKT